MSALADAERSALAALRVLLVDDEAFQLRLLRHQFARAGVRRVDAVDDARVALERIAATPLAYDLVCCDLQMPGMDGVELVRHLGRLQYGGAVVLISGEDERILQTAEQLARAHALRVLAALHKPVAPDALEQLLRASLAGPARSRTDARAPCDPEDLARGLAAQELVNHYQPKVDLASGRWVGVETLVRWQHPTLGLVGPDRFIGVAEEHGLIDALTRDVLAGPGGALQQAVAWERAGLALSVAVNVSMDNLHDHAFPDWVAGELNAAGLSPGRLILEVTESRLMRDATVTLDILTRLRLRRIGLAIDDFGTGHSSLAQLLALPFDELKIDRSFVHGAHARDDVLAILQPSLQMARRLHMTSVAEGVEDGDDWALLRACGCDLAQGWFIAPAMPAADLPAWQADWEQRRAALIA